MKMAARILSPVLIIALLLSAVAVLAPVGAAPAKAVGPIFFDSMESGAGGWTADGFWHQITGAESISVLNVGGAAPNDPPDDINPDLVTLPDTNLDGLAFLPAAFSGATSWWYGVDANGTFIDSAFNPAGDPGDPDAIPPIPPTLPQMLKNGGRSNMPNSGSLTSPVIDLTAQTAAVLEFRTWWEIEGVDADRYDMMYVQASADGMFWTNLGNLNPINDVNNESFQNYSSGGSNATPVWVHNVFDLSAYAGAPVQVRFLFDTVDPLYNGFRGWFIDDVSVTAGGLLPPDIIDVQPLVITDPTTIVKIFGTGFANGATVDIGDYPVLDSAVISSSEIHALIDPSMPNGTFPLTVTNPDFQVDSFFDIFVDLPLPAPAPIIMIVQPTTINNPSTDILIFGENFQPIAGAIVDFGGWTAADVAVLSSTQILTHINPAMPNGTYPVLVMNLDGQSSNTDYQIIVDLPLPAPAPLVEMVQPSIITDPTTTVQVFGNDFQPGAVVNFGGYLALDSMWISPSQVDAHIHPSMPNGPYWVQVINPDGQYSNSFFDIFIELTPSGLSADFSATPTYGSAPLEVQFTDLSTGPVETWQWQFGDGTYNFSQNPSYTYYEPGWYTITLTVTGPGDPGANTTVKYDYIEVTAAPLTADFSATPTVGDAPLTVQFYDESTGPHNEWWWDFGDGNNSNEQNPIHIYNLPGLYNVSLSVAGPGSPDYVTVVKNDYIIVTEHTDLVSPAYVEATLHPGENLVVEKQVTIPSSLPMVDVFILQDETGSYGSYIYQLQALAPSIFDSIRALVPDSRFGVGGFRDFPISPWGGEGDYSYRLIQDLTYDQPAFLAAVNLLTASGGNDGPEAQYDALLQSATGVSWRPDALKVVLLATDAEFHTPADGGYPGPSRDAVIAALNAAGIVVIGIDSYYYGGINPQLQDVADATGGVNVSLSGTSGDAIANAILSGLGSLVYTVQPVVVGADPFIVTYAPASYEGVAGGSMVTFTETITAPEGIEPGIYEFTVQFLANGALLGIQTVVITIPSSTLPSVDPAYVEATLHPGDSIVVEKKITIPYSILIDTDSVVSTVTPFVVGASPLDVTFNPSIMEGVSAGSTVTFLETITAPEGIAAGKYSFSVEFLSDGVLYGVIGVQEVSIVVPGVSPLVVDAVMHSGETIHVDKTAFIPGSGQMGVDIFLLQDETGSYGSYIYSLQTLAPDIFDAIRAIVPDSRFGVGGFRDFPWDPWGNGGDWPYRLIQDLTTDRTAFLDGVGLLTANGGNDGPEAQYSALYQTATGAGIDLNSDGNYTDPGEMAPGLNPTFRLDALKVVILPTDASFHTPADSGYPGPSRDEVIAALQDAGIVVIGIDSYYGSNSQLQDVADATGGVNISLSGTSGEAIADAIMNGLGSVLSYTVKPVVIGADPLVVTFDPAIYEHVDGNSALSFDESITVPWCTPEGLYSFTVEFWANDQLIGVQTVNIDVQPYPWTTLVYMAGDNSSSEQAWGALQSIGNAPFDMNPVLVLFDGAGNGDSQIFRKSYEGMVPMDDEGAVIKKNHEVNMGDPATLEDFINWGRSRGHADNYLLVLWDQGAGWRTSRFLKDWTSYGDDITLKELSAALAGATDDGANPLQVIGFDASLMQMLEVDYAVAPYAQYAVGSEEFIPRPQGGWPYGKILSNLSTDSDLTPAELAAMIVDEYGNRWTIPRPQIYAGGYGPGQVYNKNPYGTGSGWNSSYELGYAVLDLAEYQGQVYASTMYPGNVYRNDGPEGWNEVGYLGEQVTAIAEFNGQLYAAVKYDGLYRYNGPYNWEQVSSGWELPNISSLYAWNGQLYMGSDYNGIYRWDGMGSLEQVAWAFDSTVTDFAAWNGSLYASTTYGYIYSSSNGADWSMWNSSIAYDGGRNIWDIEVFQGSLYAGTDWAGYGPNEGRLYRFDSTAMDSWPVVVWSQPVWGYDYGILSMATDGGNLYIGFGKTASSYGYDGMGLVLRYDGTSVMPLSMDTFMGIGIQSLLITNQIPFPYGTLSAKDLSQIAPLAEVTNAFAVQLLGAIGTYDQEIASARANTEDFGNMLQQSPGSVDLYHFAELIAAKVPDGALGAAANAVMDAVDAAVIANASGPMHPNAHGIAIYYPDIERPMGYGDGPGGPQNLQVMVYEPAYDVDVPFAADTLWNEYLKQAPRLVGPGMLAMYIPDVMLLAHVYEDPIVRFEWPGTTAGYLPDGFTLSKPVNIIVTPEGAIDIGEVAILYSQADLNNAGILNTQLIGIASSDGEAWSLEKLTENLPTWMFDNTGHRDGPGGPTEPMTMDEGSFDPMEFLYGIEGMGDMLMGMVMGDVMEGKHYTPGYIGAVVAVPWFDMSNMAPQIYDMIPNFPAVSSEVNTALAMIATVQEDYLTPIQSPQDLDEGWNAISLPVIPLDNSIETILSGHDGLVEGVADSVEVIWSYDAATGVWSAYSPAAPEASDLAELEDGVGYWVNMKDEATLTVIGSNFLAGPHAPPEYDLLEGWNFIGYKGILPMAPQGEWYYGYSGEYYGEVYIGGYLEADKVTYNRLQGYNRVYDSLYTPDFLYPNDGYWIYVPEGGAGSIPGLNDENWINAVENNIYEWFDAAYSWQSFWMMHDGDLGMRLSWNMRWYDDWVITPSMINYWGGFFGPGPS